MTEITQEQLKKAFDYRDGRLYWKIKGRGITLGASVGTPCEIRKNVFYEYNFFKGSPRRTHRLIYLWHHGFMPTMIDHIDGNTLNNRIENLRAVTSSQNQFNRKINKNNSTGYKGISIMKVKSKKKTYKYFLASISYNNTPIKKTFSVLEDAIKFINETRVCVHGEHARYA